MFWGTNAYGWTLLAKRDGHEWDIERAMAQAKQAGLNAWEHSFYSADEVPLVAEAARKQGLVMRSAYIFGAFHEPDLAKTATENALQIAEALRAVGVRHLIFNPDPLPGGALKTDEQLRTQSAAINELARALTSAGSRFLYHTHDPEMKAGARELHHMLVNSDPEDVSLCLDAHWVYRGAGNSQVALHDVVSLYASRIGLIHLRQSVDGIWSETIGAGDIDYPAFARHLAKHNVKALMVLELCEEKGTPCTLTGTQANAEAKRYLEPLLAPLAINLQRRIYLIGAGTIARHHATGIQNLEGIELFAADPSKEARDAFAAAFPEATVYEDAETMLSSSPAQDQDIAVVAVPPRLHYSEGLRAIRSGRHVLMEKPITTSQAELDELLAAIRGTGRRLGDCGIRFVGSNKALDRARELLASGAIGSPYHARLVNRVPRGRPGIEYQPESRWFLNKDKAGGGAIFDWGVYDLTTFFDVLRPTAVRIHNAWIATPPTAVDPPGHPITVETHAGAAMTLELESGAVMALDFERALGFHGEPQSILCVDGSAGGLEWQWVPPFEESGIKLTHHVDVEGKVQSRVERFPSFPYITVHYRPLLSFIDLVEGRNSVILSEARIEFNFAVMLGIYKSAAEGKPIEVRLKQE